MRAALRLQRAALMRAAIVAPLAARVRRGARVVSVIALFRAQRAADLLSVESFHALACIGQPALSDRTLRRWITDAVAASAPAQPPGAATVTVTARGVHFGEHGFATHERIAGLSAGQLRHGTGSLASRAYMAWVRAALGQAEPGTFDFEPPKGDE